MTAFDRFILGASAAADIAILVLAAYLAWRFL